MGVWFVKWNKTKPGAAGKKEPEANIMRINWLIAVEMVTVISDPRREGEDEEAFVHSLDVEG